MNPADNNEFLELLKKRLDDQFTHERDCLWFTVVNGRLFVNRVDRSGRCCVGSAQMSDDQVSLLFWCSGEASECDLSDPKSDPVEFLVRHVKKTRLS